MAVALSTLRTRAKRRADMESSTFVVDAEWTDYINEGLAELHETIVDKSDDHIVSSTTIAVVAGTDSYALPTDFFRERGVDILTGGSTYTLSPFMFRERNRLDSYLGDVQRRGGLNYFYSIVGNNIRLIPEPSGSHTLTLWYIPEVAELSADGDEIDTAYAIGWERYVVLYAAIKALQKQEKDTTTYERELLGLQRRVEKNARRSDGDPKRVVDVRTGRDRIY